MDMYPEQKPMAMLANFYSGLSYYRLNDPHLALTSFEKVEKNFSDEDNLPGNDLKISSKLYKAQIFIKIGRKQKAINLLKEIIKTKPQSKEAQNALKMLDILK